MANTATSSVDYTKVLSGTLVFGPGETQKTITIKPIDDSLIEGAENFFVVLTAASSVTEDDAESTSSIRD